MARHKRPLADRFWERTQPEPNSGCLLWTGYAHPLGYGQIGRGGRRGNGTSSSPAKTHRVAWELVHGPIPDGLVILHKCDTPSCVNVDHLALGTQRENMGDMAQKRRAARGERHGMHKLSDAQVAEVRRRYANDNGPSHATLASTLGVSESCIGLIVRGERRAS